MQNRLANNSCPPLERTRQPFKAIPVRQAVGTVLAHDLTRILPGEFKGRAFKRGHIVREEDVAALLNMGKEHLYVWDLSEGLIHEDDAAIRLATAAAGPGIRLTEPSEGRVNFFTEHDGLLVIDVPALAELNAIEDITLASVHTHQAVTANRPVAGTRVVPLVIPEERLARAEAVCRAAFPLIQVKPFRRLSVGVVTTGSEVFHGRIKDAFGPVLRRKFSELGCQVLRQVFVPDDISMTVAAIRELLAAGAQLIAVTGGMSVDPDDQTPASIRAAGGELVTYGAPTFPGAMFLLAHIGDVPVVGLPGCVMYAKASIFDLVVPRIIAGEEVSRADITALGHGGFCAGCPECRYPVCPFGKGT